MQPISLLFDKVLLEIVCLNHAATEELMPEDSLLDHSLAVPVSINTQDKVVLVEQVALAALAQACYRLSTH